LFLLAMLMPSASAQIFKIGSPIDLKATCIYNDTFCPASTECNITIISQYNGTIIKDNLPMSNHISYHNYSLAASETTIDGEYTATMVCSTPENFYSSFVFYITPSGKEPPPETLIVFSYLLFFAIIASFLYLLVYSLEQFALMEFDLNDLIYNIIGYIFLHITNIFNNLYFQVTALTPILMTFIVVGVFSMIAIPVYMFIICYMKHIFEEHINKQMGSKW